MRAIKIDAIAKTIEECQLPATNSLAAESDPFGPYAHWRAEMHRLLETDILESVPMGIVGLWVDEEGLLRPSPGPFFRIGKPGAWGPIISKKGLLLGFDAEGEPC